METDLVAFTARSERSRYVVRRFGEYLRERVLDVGCDQALLKDLLPGIRYTGIDIGGKPDLRVDLDAVERLPFDDRSFESVVCTDVLEHLEGLHAIFHDLIRVADRYVIVSLPNNWVNARQKIERGKGSFNKYGLPLEPPSDRHRWFFSLQEARSFLEGHEARGEYRIVEMLATEKPRPVLVRALLRAKYPQQERYLNRYAHTLWAVLEKP